MRVERIGCCTLYHADCRDVLPLLGPVNVVVTDPPYGKTSLKWDRVVDGWVERINSDALWVFGTLASLRELQVPGFKFAQEIIWEKQNGSNFHADRFRRVHELAAMFYRGAWADLYKAPVYTNDATKRTVRRKKRPPHTGDINGGHYISEDGGPRLQRSVIKVRNCHGYAVHPTQKPVGILQPLCEYSCPPGGTVLDPFMGSGSTAVAAVNSCREFIGIEIDEKYFEISCERVREAYENLARQ